MTLDILADMSAGDIGSMVRHPAAGAAGKQGGGCVCVLCVCVCVCDAGLHAEIHAELRGPDEKIKACVDAFPYLTLEASLQPITRTVLRISLTLTPAFNWQVRLCGCVCVCVCVVVRAAAVTLLGSPRRGTAATRTHTNTRTHPSTTPGEGARPGAAVVGVGGGHRQRAPLPR